MNNVIDAVNAFGDPAEVRKAAVGNAAYHRARDMEYGHLVALQFARMAKREALTSDATPAEIAARIVLPKTATFAGHNGGGGGRAR